jgi:hypothetical protein
MDNGNHPCLHCASTEYPTIEINDIQFFDNGNPVRLVDCYKNITGIKIEANATNSKVCQMCQLQLKNAYTFMQKFKPCLKPTVEIKEEEEKVFEESVFVTELSVKNVQSDEVMRDDVQQALTPYKVDFDKNSTNQCLECGKNFTRAFDLLSHQETIHNTNHKMLICHYCDKEYKHKRSLREHFRNYHPQGMYECCVCGNKYSRKYVMDEHKWKEHGISNELEGSLSSHFIEVKVEKVEPTSDTNDEKFVTNSANECLVCGQKFTTPFSLRYHEEKMHNFNCKMFICHYCGKEYKRKRSLREHFAIHHSEQIYKCDVCAKKFGQQFLMDEHKFKHHRTENGQRDMKNVCLICEKSCTTSGGLLLHQRWKHNLNCEKFVCNICEFHTKYRRELTEHFLITHSIVRNRPSDLKFECNICAKTYSRGKSLRYHQEKMHNPNCEKYICYFCEYETKYKTRMRSHMKIKHLAVGEAYSGKGIFQIGGGAARPYKVNKHREESTNANGGCIVCDKVYPSKQLLYRHQQTIHIVSSIGGKNSIIIFIKITIFCS